MVFLRELLISYKDSLERGGISIIRASLVSIYTIILPVVVALLSSCASKERLLSPPSFLSHSAGVITLPDDRVVWCLVAGAIGADISIASSPSFSLNVGLGDHAERITYPVPAHRAKAVILRVLQERLGLVATNPDAETIQVLDCFPGRYRGILWWKKRWQERILYSIFVLNVASSGGKDATVVRINFLSQERPNENFSWRTSRSEEATERLYELILRIDSELRRKE